MRWIWQQSGWPDFRYDKRALEDRELEFHIRSARLAGRFEALPRASQEDATVDLIFSEAIKTNAIEGEELDRESVRSSLLFYEAYGDQLNDRQASMVSRVFAEGRKGFEGGITTRKYEVITKCPNRTASRDLSDLVAKGIITPLPGGGRMARYELADINATSVPETP